MYYNDFKHDTFFVSIEDPNLNENFIDAFIATLHLTKCIESIVEILESLKKFFKSSGKICVDETIYFEKELYILQNMKNYKCYFESDLIYDIHKGKFYFLFFSKFDL